MATPLQEPSMQVGESGPAASSRRPTGCKIAKEESKKLEIQESVLVKQAKASVEIAYAILEKVPLGYEENSLLALFSLVDEHGHISQERKDWLHYRRSMELET
ncbi:unnamed protein product [Calypogeia fissa]